MIPLTLASTLTDRTRPVLDGRHPIPGVALTHLPGEPEEIFARAMREAPFDITELSMGSHILAVAGGQAPYVGVPVFLSRAYRHNGIWVRWGARIETPADLAGRVVALAAYEQTAPLWVRGMLRDQHGVDTRGIAWRVVAERSPLALPPGFDVAPLGCSLDQAFAEGQIDAFIGPRIPGGAADGSVTRLWADPRSEEEAYRAATGFFPIMHCLAVRQDVAAAHPWLPAALFQAFTAAKNASLREMLLTNVLRVSLPFSAYDAQAQVAAGDPWPYGLGRNREEIAAMIRYAHEDGLMAEPIPPEALFHPSVLDLVDPGP